MGLFKALEEYLWLLCGATTMKPKNASTLKFSSLMESVSHPSRLEAPQDRKSVTGWIAGCK